MTAAVDDARQVRASRTTSIWFWLAVVVIAVALLVVRLPLFIAVAEASLASAAAELGDPAMSGTAIAVGAGAAVALHAIGIAVVAALAALLERFLGPRALGSGPGRRLRLGVGGLTLAILVLGQQVAAIVTGAAAVERGLPLWIAAAVVALSTPLLFAESRSALRSYAKALVVSGVIGGLLCIG